MQHPSDHRHVMHEADIGSGERTPGQRDTDAMIEKVPRKPEQRVPERPAPQPHSEPAQASRRR